MSSCVSLCAACLGLLGLAQTVQAGIAVRFGASSYPVAAGSAYTVSILVDGDDQQPGDQPVAQGLFSFGLRMVFPPASASVAGEGLAVVPALDYAGLVPGAKTEQGPDYVLCRGNVAFVGKPEAFPGGTLLTVTLRNLAPVQSRYVLSLESARTNSAENVFVDGAGRPLDSTITYGRAEVVVTPAPTPVPPRITIRPLPPGAVEVTFPVTSGRDHFLEVTEDLRVWRDLFLLPRNDGRVILKSTALKEFLRLRTSPTQ